MIDSAMDDFMKRYGDNDPNKKMVQHQFRAPSKAVQEEAFSLADVDATEGLYKNAKEGLASLKEEELATGAVSELVPKGIGELTGSMPDQLKTEATSGVAKKGLSGADAVSGGMGLVTTGMQAFSDFKGDGYETDADSGGPRGAGAKAVSGAANGFKAGMDATGNPLIAAGIGLVAGVAPIVGRGRAAKEYKHNQYVANSGESALQKAQRQRETDTENGLASMKSLKGLREKQLGIYNT
jgi:hypothetical protein